jgi:hypothetical protein
LLLTLHLFTAQSKPAARIEAEGDPRNAVSFLGMAAYFRNFIDPSLHVNMDATTFKIEIDGDEVVWHIREDGDKEQVQREGQMNTVVFIKEMCFTNSYGNISETVYIIQDPNMHDEDCKHYVVRDLGSSMLNATHGHIFVMKSRAANMKFNDLYFRKVIIPYINDIRTTFRLSKDIHFDADEASEEEDEEYSDVPVLFTFDGEKVQLDGFMSPELLDFCTKSYISMVKLAASCTKIQQLLDACKKFDSKKKAMRAVKDYIFRNPQLEATLQQIFKGHPGISQKQVKAIIAGIHELHWADVRTLTREKIVYGAKTIGLFPFNPEQILDNCTWKWSLEDRQYILRIITLLGTLFGKHGRVPDEDMDDLNIPVSDKLKSQNKDSNALVHERVVLINHEESQERSNGFVVIAAQKAEKKAELDSQKAVTDPISFDNVMKLYNDNQALTLLPATALKGALRHMKGKLKMNVTTSGNKVALAHRLMMVLDEAKRVNAT